MADPYVSPYGQTSDDPEAMIRAERERQRRTFETDHAQAAGARVKARAARAVLEDAGELDLTDRERARLEALRGELVFADEEGSHAAYESFLRMLLDTEATLPRGSKNRF